MTGSWPLINIGVCTGERTGGGVWDHRLGSEPRYLFLFSILKIMEYFSSFVILLYLSLVKK